MGLKMFKIRQRDKELSISDKLDFAIETGIITLVFGTILSHILLSLFSIPFVSVGNLIVGFLLNTFKHTIIGIPGLVFFVLIFRGLIYLLNLIKISGNLKLIISIVIGLALIIISINYYYPLEPIYQQGKLNFLLLTILPYIFSFLFYILYANIWNSIKLDRSDLEIPV